MTSFGPVIWKGWAPRTSSKEAAPVPMLCQSVFSVRPTSGKMNCSIGTSSSLAMSPVEIGGCRKDTFLGLVVGDRVAEVSDRSARGTHVDFRQLPVVAAEGSKSQSPNVSKSPQDQNTEGKHNLTRLERHDSQSVSYFTVPPRAHPSIGSQSGSATPVLTQVRF